MNYKAIGSLSLVAGLVAAVITVIRIFTKTSEPKRSATNGYGDWDDSLGV